MGGYAPGLANTPVMDTMDNVSCQQVYTLPPPTLSGPPQGVSSSVIVYQTLSLVLLVVLGGWSIFCLGANIFFDMNMNDSVILWFWLGFLYASVKVLILGAGMIFCCCGLPGGVLAVTIARFIFFFLEVCGIIGVSIWLLVAVYGGYYFVLCLFPWFVTLALEFIHLLSSMHLLKTYFTNREAQFTTLDYAPPY